MRDLLLATALGGIAGVGVGLLVRSVAKSQLEQAVLLGSTDLARRLREGRARALRDTPREVREGVSAGITQGLQSVGLSRTELRQYVAYARQAQELVRRFS